MDRIKSFLQKITSQSNLMIIAGWIAFLFGQMLSPDLFIAKISFLSVARVLP
jgi:hypothetical protein